MHKVLYVSHCSFTSVDPYTEEPSMDDNSLINGQDGNWGPERWSDLPTVTFWAKPGLNAQAVFIPIILPRSVAYSRAENAEGKSF